MASRCTGGCHQRAPCIGRAIASWSISRTAQSSASSTARSCAARCGVPPWRRPRRSHRGATAGMLQQREDTAAGPDPFAPTSVRSGSGMQRPPLLLGGLRRRSPHGTQLLAATVDFTKLVREIELVGEHSIPRAQLPRLPRQGLEHGVLLQRACQRRALRLCATLSVASGFIATSVAFVVPMTSAGMIATMKAPNNARGRRKGGRGRTPAFAFTARHDTTACRCHDVGG